MCKFQEGTVLHGHDLSCHDFDALSSDDELSLLLQMMKKMKTRNP